MSDGGLDPNMIIAAVVVGLPATIAAYGSIGAKREAAGANRAVNHKAEGSPSIAEQIEAIDARTKATAFDLTELRKDVGANSRVVGVIRTEMTSLSRRLDQHLAHPEEDR